MKMILALAVIISGVGLIGCGDHRPVTKVARESVQQTVVEMPHYPDFFLLISMPGVRECGLGLEFPITPGKSPSTRLGCGIDQTVYDAQIEYLRREENGDRYRVTIFKPYPEGASENDKNRVIHNDEILFAGDRIEVFRMNGVSFIADQ